MFFSEISKIFAGQALSPITILIEYSVCVVFQVPATIIFSVILYRSRYERQRITLAPVMALYISCSIIQCLFCLIHIGYLVVFFDTENVTYNAYIFFYTGAPATLSLMTNSLSTSFLSLDRILTVLYPHNKALDAKYLVVFIIIFTAVIAYLDFIPDYPEISTTTCRSFACTRTETQGVIYMNVRYFVAAINLIFGAVLGILIRKQFRDTNRIAKANKTVFSIMIIACFCDFLPHGIGYMRHALFNFDITSLDGPHSMLYGALDVGICSILYFKTFLKPSSCKGRIIRVSHTQPIDGPISTAI